MLFLKTFGGLSVESDGTPGSGAARQRKTLALLALLAAAGRRGTSRDKLSAYLWPESDAEHARNLLKQACYALRRDLQAPAVFLGAVQLRLNPDVITSDLQSFEDALDRGDPARAVAAHTGPFLDGFYLAGAGEFERWVEETRAALKRRVGEALESLATQAAAAEDARTAVKWWRQLAALDPLSAHPALGLLRALVAAGERTSALAYGRAHEHMVRQELGAAPDPAVSELLIRLRGEVGEATAVGTESGGVSGSTAFDIPGLATVRTLPRATRVRRRLAVGGGVLALLVSVVVASSRRPTSLEPDLLVVAPFDVRGPELELWREGLVDLLSRSLDGALQLRTVSPSLAVRRWEGRADRQSAQRLGRRTGAGLVLFGELTDFGPDSVRLRAGILDARKDRTLAEFERMERADRVDRLADSLSLDVMRALTPTTAPAYPRLLSTGTKSLPALRAFLQGERYLRQYSLDSAIASYERAIALDTTFAVALRHLGVALAWNLQPGADHYLARAEAHNYGLTPRDSLMVEYSWAPDPDFYRVVRRREAILGEMIERYPEDPELWQEVGDVQFHLGFFWPDSTWNRARRSFNGAIARDSDFALAYIHPVEIALNDNDPEGALQYVRGYLAVPSVNREGAGMYLLSLVLDPERTRRRDFERELEAASLTTLRRLAVAIRSWPDAEETQIQVARRLLATTRASFSSQPADLTTYSLRLYQSLLASVLIFRGHVREARGLVGDRLAMAPFMELALMGAILADTVESALARGVPAPDAGDHVVFPWIMEAACFRTLDAALWWASSRDTARLRRLVQREDSAARALNPAEVAPYARPAPKFARAALALARGDTGAALRGFVPDSTCPGAQQPRATQFRLLVATGRDAEAAWAWDRLYVHRVPLMLERARVAERLGDRPGAIKYYRFVVQAWRNADAELQPVVSEARAGLQRMGGESP